MTHINGRRKTLTEFSAILKNARSALNPSPVSVGANLSPSRTATGILNASYVANAIVTWSAAVSSPAMT
ncbi:unnamed protein product [Dicrocoelium dendriticum]|nr:unnamed protein product [Dicrocoelium dendriticum]